MNNQLLVRVTLVGNRVDSENDEWLSYQFPKTFSKKVSTKRGDMGAQPPKKDRKRAFEIVKDSLYSYPVKQIAVNDEGDAVATLQGPQSAFEKANMENTGNIYLDTVVSLAYNYGDGGPDGWMEGDISIDPKHELWLGLSKVEFYQNGQLYLLFDDSEQLDWMGSLRGLSPL